MTIYKIKPGQSIIHNRIKYYEGNQLELLPEEALVHANSIETVTSNTPKNETVELRRSNLPKPE